MRRVAVVTGSESGIGRATAIALARRGYAVGVTWLKDEDAAQVTAVEVREAGGTAAVKHIDVAEHTRAPRALDALADELGGLDVLVNNAGVGFEAGVLESTVEQWRETFDTNVLGAFVLAQAAARRMIATSTRGRIVNVTSVHAHAPPTRAVSYSASKGALKTMTEVLALELAEHGITVNAVAPGFIATAMTGNAGTPAASVPRAMVPAGRAGEPAEVAEAVAHLAAPESAYVTGMSYVVDGGMLLMPVEADQRTGP